MIKMIISVVGYNGNNLSEIKEIQVKVLRGQEMIYTTIGEGVIEQRISATKTAVSKICRALKNDCKNNIYVRFTEKHMTIYIKDPFKESNLTQVEGETLTPYMILGKLFFRTTCQGTFCDECELYDGKKESCLLVDLRDEIGEEKNMW